MRPRKRDRWKDDNRRLCLAPRWRSRTRPPTGFSAEQVLPGAHPLLLPLRLPGLPELAFQRGPRSQLPRWVQIMEQGTRREGKAWRCSHSKKKAQATSVAMPPPRLRPRAHNRANKRWS